MCKDGNTFMYAKSSCKVRKRRVYYEYRLPRAIKRKHRRTNNMARAKVTDTRDWLKDLRKEKGLTVRKIAPMVGISFSHYNDIENGRRNPSLKVAIKMSDFLEFDVKKLA